MSDQNVNVEISATASGVESAAADTKQAISSLAASIAQLSSSMNAQAAAISDGFGKMAAASAATRAEIAKDAEEEELSLLGVIKTVHEGVESFGQFRAALSEIGEVWLAAFAVERVVEFAKQMGEVQEKTEHTAQQFGVSTDAIQQVGGAMTLMGVSADKGTMAFGRLAKAYITAGQGSKMQADAFKQLGVDVSQSRTSMEVLAATMDGFKNMADGPMKLQIAMSLLGRSGKDLIPFLDLGSAGFTELTRVMEQYGVQNKDAVEKGSQLGSAFNENKVAMSGLNNVLTQALAPSFSVLVQGVNSLAASFITSYRQGGVAKGVMDAIVITLNVLGKVIGMVADVFGALFGALFGQTITANGLLAGFSKAIIFVGDVLVVVKAVFVEFFQWVGSGINQLEIAFGTLGHVINDSLHGNFDQAGKDIKQGFTEMGLESARFQAQVHKDTQDVVHDWAEMGKASPHRQVQTTGERDTDDEGSHGTPDAKKDKSQMPTLEAGYAAFEEERTEHGKMLTDEYQDQLDYWSKVLAGTKLSVEDRQSVEKKILEAETQLNKQRAQSDLAAIKQETSDELAAASTQLANTKEAIQSQTRAVEDGMREKLISQKAGAAQLAALNEQETAAEETAAERKYEITEAGIEHEINYYRQGTVEYERLLGEETAAKQAMVDAGWRAVAEGIAREQAAQAAATKLQVDQTRQAYTQIGDFARTTTEGLINGTESWQQVWNKCLEGMLDLFLKFVEQQVVTWATAETTKTAATQAGVVQRVAAEAYASAQTILHSVAAAVVQIANAAYVAAANAYAALAAVPIVGPVLAPAAAAAALAAVIAFGAHLASAAGGWGQVGEDQIAQVHKDEMVLPANIAGFVRSAAAGWTTGSTGLANSSTFGGGGGGGGGGPTKKSGDTINMSIGALDSRSVSRYMDSPKIVSSAAAAFKKHGKMS